MRSASHSICRVAGGVYDGVFFVLSFFPRDVLGEILDLIEFLRVFLPNLSVIDLLLSFLLLLLYVHGKPLVMSRRLVNIITLYLGRVRPPKRLSSTKCLYSLQYLKTVLLKAEEGEKKFSGRTWYRTQDLRLLNKPRNRLRYATRLSQAGHAAHSVACQRNICESKSTEPP